MLNIEKNKGTYYYHIINMVIGYGDISDIFLKYGNLKYGIFFRYPKIW